MTFDIQGLLNSLFNIPTTAPGVVPFNPVNPAIVPKSLPTFDPYKWVNSVITQPITAGINAGTTAIGQGVQAGVNAELATAQAYVLNDIAQTSANITAQVTSIEITLAKELKTAGVWIILSTILVVGIAGLVLPDNQ